MPLGIPLDKVEKEYILASLQKNGGNKARTAEVLGISEKTLYNKLNRYAAEARDRAASERRRGAAERPTRRQRSAPTGPVEAPRRIRAARRSVASGAGRRRSRRRLGAASDRDPPAPGPLRRVERGVGGAHERLGGVVRRIARRGGDAERGAERGRRARPPRASGLAQAGADALGEDAPLARRRCGAAGSRTRRRRSAPPKSVSRSSCADDRRHRRDGRGRRRRGRARR